MKTTFLCLTVGLIACLAGCSPSHDKVGDAPRTESKSSMAGWKEIATSGVAVRFPEDWKMMDLSAGALEQGADKVFGSDPKYAAMRSQASAMAKQGTIKLLAFEPLPPGGKFATNCNVMVQTIQSGPTLEQIAEASVQQIKPMVAAGTAPKLEYPSLGSDKTALIRSEIKPADPAMGNLVSLGYVKLKGSTMAVVTFTAPAADEAHIREVADQSMRGFRFTQ